MNVVTYSRTNTIFFIALGVTIASTVWLLLSLILSMELAIPGICLIGGVGALSYIAPLFWESLINFYYDSQFQVLIFNMKLRQTTQLECFYHQDRLRSIKVVQGKKISAHDKKEISERYGIDVSELQQPSEEDEWYIVMGKEHVIVAKEYYTIRTYKLLGYAQQNVFIADTEKCHGNLIVCSSVSSSEIKYPHILFTALRENMYLEEHVRDSVPRKTLENYETVIAQYDYALRKSRMNIDKLRPRTKYVFSGVSSEAGLPELQPYMKYIIAGIIAIGVVLAWILLI